MTVLAGRRGPVLLAFALALVSVPLVAISLVQPLEDWQQEIVNAPALGWLNAAILALVSVIVASIVGGSLGGRLVRTQPVKGVLLALGTAWPIGIGMLSITAAILGIPLRLGVLCIDTCTASITNENAGSGLFQAYPMSLAGAGVFIVPVVLAIVMLVGGVLLARRGRSVAAIVITVGAYASLHVMSVLLGGGIAFACLLIGVIAWALTLRRTVTDEIEPALSPA